MVRRDAVAVFCLQLNLRSAEKCLRARLTAENSLQLELRSGEECGYGAITCGFPGGVRCAQEPKSNWRLFSAAPSPTEPHFQQAGATGARFQRARKSNWSAISADAPKRGAMKPTCMIVEQCEDDGGPPERPKQGHRLENHMVKALMMPTKVTLGSAK